MEKELGKCIPGLKKPRSEEHHNKLIKALKGIKHPNYPKKGSLSQEHKDNISKSMMGKNRNNGLKISLKTKNVPKPEGFGIRLSKPVLQYDLAGTFIKE